MNNTFNLNGQIAVITGGSGAIGSAIMNGLQDRGARAIALDRVPPADSAALWQQCDMTRDESVEKAITSVQQEHGRIDIAVHAAGISRDAVAWKLSVEDWDAVQAVNLRGAFLLVRQVIPIMRSRPSGGRIILIGSINGSRGKFGASAYSASKAGLLGFCKSLARETGRFQILVNVIEPGWVRTPLTEKVPKRVLDAALAESLIGKLIEPEDIANTVTFLSGPTGSRITGQILRVDGGQFLGTT